MAMALQPDQGDEYGLRILPSVSSRREKKPGDQQIALPSGMPGFSNEQAEWRACYKVAVAEEMMRAADFCLAKEDQ
jgi:hypothetical protein